LNSTHPAAFAYFDLIMSILTIPLLYAFCRLYFSPKHSLIITSLYAFSFLVIQYSRFAWNPNSVPFLMLLTFYGMLRFAQSKKSKNQIKWLALWALGFSLASQFHFYAFFALVGICGIFFLYHFNLFQLKKLPENIKKVFTKNLLKAFGIALGVILLTYTPMIISELKTDFSNSKLFFGAFSEKSRDDKTFNEKLIRNFREQAKGYFLITTSFEHRSGNKADPIPVSFGLMAMLIGIALPIYFYRKEKSPTKKNFLFLIPTWIIFFFLLTISTSYGLRPRYFVPVFPMPFIIIGLFFVWLDKNIPKKAYLLTTLIAIAVLFLNLYGIKQWFVNTALSQNEAIPTYRNLILKKDDGITLGQFERATNYILKKTPSSEKHVLIWSKAEYKQPLSYLLERQRPDVNWDWVNKSEELYEKNLIFAVNTTSGGHDSVSKYVKNYTNLQTSIQFGQIIVMKLKINSSEIPKPEPKEEEDQGDGGKTERLFWKDVI
jgi:hypothetical protein